jgi:short-chain Z-isoprenyl diphosphate synthase
LSVQPPEVKPEVGPDAAAATLPARRARARPRRAAGLLARADELALAPLYRLYTHRLRERVRRAPLPEHVAVIIDGNRRWALELGLTEPGAGHHHGAAKIDELLAWCSSLGIGEVTVWALSGENVGSRPDAQLQSLLDVVAQKLEALAQVARDPRLPLRIHVFGRRDALPEPLRHAAQRAEAASAPEGIQLNIALGYSGRDELVDACRRLVEDLASDGIDANGMASRVTREALAARLYTAGRPDPDLIIRTSGELRLSGFLPWQSAHSEFYFTDVYWPAFRELDFLRALRTFQQRDRRYGA